MSYQIYVFGYYTVNVKTQGPSLQCVWFECDANNVIVTLSLSYECHFDHHVSPYAIPNTWGMTGDMLSFHEFLQYFYWHCSKRAQAIPVYTNEDMLDDEQKRSRGSSWS